MSRARVLPLEPLRVPDLEQLREHVRQTVRVCMSTLQAAGWGGWDIADACGAGSRSRLYRWRSGEVEPTYSQFKALKRLAAQARRRPLFLPDGVAVLQPVRSATACPCTENVGFERQCSAVRGAAAHGVAGVSVAKEAA